MSAPDGFRHWYKKRDELAEIVREKRRELDEAEHQLQWASRQMMDAWRRMGEEAAASTVSAGQESNDA